MKKASPSKGVIRADFDPVAIARTYQQHGAACLSVLTDRPYFQGSLEYLRQVRAAVDLPVLRKDFIIDPYQVVEARAAGADAVLLIAECLDDDLLERLHDAIVDLGMTPLVELYEPANLARVLRVGARLVGINNRDLRTFQTDLEHTLRLRREIPADRIVVGESGIRSRQDVERLEAAGVQAMLVGETLMASPDMGTAVDELLGKEKRTRTRRQKKYGADDGCHWCVDQCPSSSTLRLLSLSIFPFVCCSVGEVCPILGRSTASLSFRPRRCAACIHARDVLRPRNIPA